MNDIKSHSSSKKHKKHKKRQKKHKKDARSSDSDSSEAEMEWVEATEEPKEEPPKAESPKAKFQHEDWMNTESFVHTLTREELTSGSSSRQRKKELREQEKAMNESIHRSRELNPHWQNEGSGLPQGVPVEEVRLPSTSVGDGGYAYLKKAYLRIQEQAQDEGRSMEQVAKERWGSLQKLESMIEEAEARMKHLSRNRHKPERHREERRSPPRFQRPRHPSSPDNRSIQYQKPKEYDRKRKEVGKFRSSDLKIDRSHRDERGLMDERDSSSSHRSDRFASPPRSSWKKVTKEGGEDSKKKLDESPPRSPAWKKKVKSDDSQPQSLVDERDSSSSHRSDRFASPPRSSWKKVTKEDSKKKLDESPPRSPAWKKKVKSDDSQPQSLMDERDSSSSHRSDRFASPPRSSWKKVTKEGGEDSKKKLDESVPRSPAWKKKVKSGDSQLQESPEKSPTREEAPLPIVSSKDDLNKLAAKYLKADMLGNKALAAKLKEELERAKRAFEEGAGEVGGGRTPRERVLLTKMDSCGVQRPVQASREDAGFERRSGHKKTVNKYFDDGSKYSLKQMFEREKLTTADDNLEMFMEVAAEAKESTDDNETAGITRKASHKMSHGVQEEKDIQKAIKQHQKMSSALEKCELCMDQPNMKHHLLVDVRKQVYVCVPNYESLTKGHCLIVPKRHVPSLLNLDEDEWDEIEEVKSLLRSVFRAHRQSALFLETSMNFRWCPHATLECIPVPEEEGDMAPFYFKKAILESEEEWAHNVKLVDLSKKGLRRSVPKNLPYFCVLFDPAVHAGYAHVIENEKIFSRNFGKEVVGGMLDIDYNHLYKNKKADPLKKSNEALELTKMIEAASETT